MHSNCNWFCALCKKCHANACPSFWGGTPEVPCGHEENPMITTEVTYENGTDEQLHPDPAIASRFIEVAMSDCEYGCKIYADPMSTVKVLGHNKTYGCTKTKAKVLA